MDGVTAKEMAVFPGMELMSALFYIEEFQKSKRYDVVVMDTAPTADTLRLLAFPDIANWYFDHLFGMVKNMLKLARVTVGKLVSTPLPSDKFLDDLEDLRVRLGYVQDLLTDPEITSVRLVVNPEKMVITETQRAYTYLCLYGYTVEALVINRIIPDDRPRRLLRGEARGAEEAPADHRRDIRTPGDAPGGAHAEGGPGQEVARAARRAAVRGQGPGEAHVPRVAHEDLRRRRGDRGRRQAPVPPGPETRAIYAQGRAQLCRSARSRSPSACPTRSPTGRSSGRTTRMAG